VVTINDVFVGGTPEQILSSIDPTTVESVEVKTGVNVLYGNVGGGGIVAVYTKKGASDQIIAKAQNFQRIKVPGYAPARRFRYPNYDDPDTDKTQTDFRSTIYWNPMVVTDPKTGTATITFYTADLVGSYRILAEGITQNGEPLRAEAFILIER